MIKSGTVIQTPVTEDINKINIIVGIHKEAFYELMTNFVSSSPTMNLENWYQYIDGYISYLTIPVTYISSLEKFNDLTEKYIDACIERLLSMPFTSPFIVIDRRNIIRLKELEDFDNYILKSCLVDKAFAVRVNNILLKNEDVKDLVADMFQAVTKMKSKHIVVNKGALKVNHMYLLTTKKATRLVKLIYIMGKISATEYLYCQVDNTLQFNEVETIEKYLLQYFIKNYKNKILTVLQGTIVDVKLLNTKNKIVLNTNLDLVPLMVDSETVEIYKGSDLYNKYKENLEESI